MKQALYLSTLLLAWSVQVQAEEGVWAEVMEVTPLKEFVNEPHRECWAEKVTEYRESARYQPDERYSPAGAVVGAVTGGVIGNRMGSGRGRGAATAAGIVIGALIGDRIDNHDYYVEPEIHREPVTRSVERCKEQRNYRAVIKRYHVVYRHNGVEGETYLQHHPGTRLRLDVPAEPVR